MLNRKRTQEVLGYDFDPSKRRRTIAEIAAQPGVTKKSELQVVDNCPSCGVERIIKYRQSKKNRLCSKCFHNTDEMINAKRNQSKFVSPATRQKMKDNHWSTKGMESAFKGKKHTEEAKEKLRQARLRQYKQYTDEEIANIYIKGSCTQRGIEIEDFDGFSAPEGVRIRESVEGRAWRYDVLSKGNFICVKCNQRGVPLVAHHIEAFNKFTNKRMDLDNGACLCRDCHNEFHNQFGRGNNTKAQFLQFLN